MRLIQAAAIFSLYLLLCAVDGQTLQAYLDQREHDPDDQANPTETGVPDPDAEPNFFTTQVERNYSNA